jgi:hypothetical protein
MTRGLGSHGHRLVAFASAALLVFSTFGSPAAAAPRAAESKRSLAKLVSSDVTDFGAARRHRHYRRGNSAAGAAFVGMAFGMIAGAIAAEQRREYYENYGYYSGPGYYGPGYYHGPYYGPRYYYPY